MKIQKLIAYSAAILEVFTLFLVAVPLAATTFSVSKDSVVYADPPSFDPGSKIPVHGDANFSAVKITDFPTFIQNAGTQILNIVLVIVAVVAVFFLILYGFQYLTAGGDPEKAKKARGGIINAIIGIIIIASAFYIVDVALQSSSIFSGVASPTT